MTDTQELMKLTDAQIFNLMMETWGCASISPRHAPSFARAIEAAIMEKLASAELPEPAATVERTSSGIGATISEYLDCGTCVYTADQLTAWGNTRFAQGAAAQLSSDPVGNAYNNYHGSWGVLSVALNDGTELYTRRQA